MARPKRISLDRLAGLSVDDLRQEWKLHYDTSAPTISADLLRMGLAWHMQEKLRGGLDRNTRAVLRQVPNEGADRPNTPRRKLSPGTRLVRDWHGVGHSVTVLENGFDYAGKHWTSLSAIAGAITGTKWNGPRFFGLTGRVA